MVRGVALLVWLKFSQVSNDTVFCFVLLRFYSTRIYHDYKTWRLWLLSFSFLFFLFSVSWRSRIGNAVECCREQDRRFSGSFLHCHNLSFPLVQQTLYRTLAGPFVRCWQSVNKFGALRSCDSCFFGGSRSGFTRATGGFSSNRYVTCVFCSVLLPFYSMCITIVKKWQFERLFLFCFLFFRFFWFLFWRSRIGNAVDFRRD